MQDETTGNEDIAFNEADIPSDFSDMAKVGSDAVAQEIMAEAQAEKLKRDGVTGIKGLMLGRSDSYRVSPFDIHVKPGFNSRDFSLPENKRHVAELAASIAQHGVLHPLTCYMDGDKLTLTDGESRLRAVMYAINHLGVKVMSVPVMMEPKGSNDGSRMMRQIASNSGKRFNPVEQGRLIAKMLRLGYTAQRIAQESGNITVGQIASLLKVAEMPEALQQHVAAGEIGVAAATKLARTHGSKAADKVKEAIAAAPEKGRGKGKATASSLGAVGADKMTFKQEVTQIIASAEVLGNTRTATEIKLKTAAWKRLRELLKLEG